MKVNAISSGLHHQVSTDKAFATILVKIIIPHLAKIGQEIPDFNDYCLFIKIEPSALGSKITFHDGGAKYDKQIDEVVYVSYATVSCDYPVHEESTLYYGVSEGVLCYLDER